MDWREVWRRVFPRKMIDPDVREEIAFHIQGRVRELVSQGWDDHEARAHVMARFGDIESVEEACRAYAAQRVDGESWRMMMEAWVRDIRFGLRSLRRDAGFTLAVVVTLALGIGATTAVFSVVESILLRPLPFPDAHELAVVWQNDRASGTVRENASTSDYFDYLERNRSFEDMAIFGLGTAVLTRDDAEPIQLNVARVSESFRPVLGVDMQLGRSFTEDEDVPGGASVVLLTDHIWRDGFGADPQIVGKVLMIDDVSMEVVGVLPPQIDYPAAETDIWLPIRQVPTIATRPNHWVGVIGRLRGDATVESAQADMTRIMADLEVEYPDDNLNRGAFVESLEDVGRGNIRTTLWVLFGAVLAVLAIACVNATNLLLARGASRGGELAVLTALGAGTRQITRKFLVEGALLSVAAGVGGVALAVFGVRALTALAPSDLLGLGDTEVRGAVLFFASCVTILICAGFALVPVLQARSLDVQSQLKDGRTNSTGSAGLTLRRLLVAGQLSLAVVLLLGATLLIGTVKNLQGVDPGFRAESMLRADFVLPPSRYPADFSVYPDWPEIHTFVRSLVDGVEGVPGVRSAAVVLNHPLERGFTNSFRVEGRVYDPGQGEITTRLVTPGYFGTAGVALEEGRLLESIDRIGAPMVVVLNRQAADRYFPQGDAVGSRLAFWGPDFREVVGIVGNERIHGLGADVPAAMYVPMYQSPPLGGKITLMARTEVAPLSIVAGIRGAMRTVDPGVPMFNVFTMEATLSQAMARERFASSVLTAFAVVALLLAALGVHGVLAYLVAQRGHEVGVRMALGATRRDVVTMVVRQSASMTVTGVVAGLVAAFAVARGLRGLLFGVSPTDPVAYLAVAVLLTLIAIGATVLPAHRASSIDPASSLRGD